MIRTYYEDHTWQEIRDMDKSRMVVVQPIASVEDHGYHLRLDTDNIITKAVCKEAVENCKGTALLLPHLPYGVEAHHMDFPGTISIDYQHLIDYITDVTKSLAHHGFRKILIVNGHGSNHNPMEIASRLTNIQTEAECFSCSYWSLTTETVKEIRDSPSPGGIAHAGEFETSLYLHLKEEGVDMSRTVKEIYPGFSKYFYVDLVDGSGPATTLSWWSGYTESGVMGDATVATKEKGRLIYEAAVSNLTGLIKWMSEREKPQRKDHH